jgi:hypothetical protein
MMLHRISRGSTRLAPVVILALGFVALPCLSRAERSGDWKVERETSDVVEFTMRYEQGSSRHIEGHSMRIRELEGFQSSWLETSTPNVRFALRRDAGSFQFEGRTSNGKGGGDWTFVPDAGFADQMVRRGYERPTEAVQFHLAFMDVGLAFMDELKAQGYQRPSTRELVTMANHGVDLDYLRAMGKLGYRVEDPEVLVKMRDHGVDPDYIAAMIKLGYKDLEADELVYARDHGVDADFIQAFGSQLKGLSLQELVRLRDHGVDAEFAAGFRELGYRDLDPKELVTLRDHGVDPEYARAMGAAGFRRARDHGVDADYVRRVRARIKGTITIDDVIEFRDRGLKL